MNFLGLFIFFFISLISLSMFIDRYFLSSKGFKSFIEFEILSLVSLCSFVLFLFLLIETFQSLTNKSLLFILLLYHVMAFLTINFILTNIICFVFYLDYLLKTYFNKIKFSIFTCKYIYYKNLLNNKRFLILSISISYILSTLVILFPVPEFILSIAVHNKDIMDFAKSQIETYQKFFVFSCVSIIFSLMKRK